MINTIFFLMLLKVIGYNICELQANMIHRIVKVAKICLAYKYLQWCFTNDDEFCHEKGFTSWIRTALDGGKCEVLNNL